MQALFEWLDFINWGQFDILKYIIVAVLVISMFDLLLGFITSFISSVFSGGKK